MRSTFKLLTVLACTVISDLTLAQDPPTLQDFVSALKKRHEDLENLHVKATWTDYVNGQLVATEHQEIHLDSLARIRVNYAVEQASAPRLQVEECYDGEVTVFYKRDPSRDRLGATNSEKTVDDIFRSAVLNPGLFPAGQGPSKHRNPFTFLSESVISELQNTLNDETLSVAISPVESRDGVWKLTYQSPLDESGDQQSNVIVDETKGWVILSHEITSVKEDRPLAIKYSTFKRYGDAWLPDSGGWKPSSADPSGESTSMEWKFVVTEIELDSPDFDDSVFTIELPTGTYVTDNRHSISYWVGSEASVGDDTTRLAQVAVAERDARKRELSYQPKQLNDPGTFFKWLVGVNLLVVVALVVAFWRTRKRT